MLKLKERFGEKIQGLLNAPSVEHNRRIGVDNVFQEIHPDGRPVLEEVVAELAGPESRIEGKQHLVELARLAESGASCLILPEHLSNFDVPVLWYLMKHAGEACAAAFERIVFIAGRKLNEESPIVKVFAEMFTRLIVSPKTFYDEIPDGPEKEELIRQSQLINRAAYRRMKELKKNGYIFLLYPTGTRYRPWEPESGRGLREVDSYLRSFDYFVTGATLGNLLPPQQGVAMEDEIPVEEDVVMRFSPVQSAAEFRSAAIAAAPQGADPKQYAVDRIMEQIAELKNGTTLQMERNR